MRALDDARGRLEALRRRLSKFLLRHGLVFNETTPPAKEGQLDRRPLGMDQCHKLQGESRQRSPCILYRCREAEAEDKKWLEALVKDEASKARWRKRVDSIRCLKGIDVMSAADLVRPTSSPGSKTPILRRMARLTSEHSSGESVRQGGITKPATSTCDGCSSSRLLALSERVSALQRPPATHPDPAARRHAAKGVRRPREEARGDAGARRPQEQGQCRHGQRELQPGSGLSVA